MPCNPRPCRHLISTPYSKLQKYPCQAPAAPQWFPRAFHPNPQLRAQQQMRPANTISPLRTFNNAGPLAQFRTFTTTSPSFKKKQKQKLVDSEYDSPVSSSISSDADSDADTLSTLPEQKDPHNFTTFEGAIAKVHEYLRTELQKVKVGGTARDLDGIEATRVNLGKGDARTGPTASASSCSPSSTSPTAPESSTETVTVGDIASIVPRGRTVQVIVGEKAHVKPLLSALAQPPQNLNAQPSPDGDPLTFTISIPPITQDARAEAASLASKKGDSALSAIRDARGAQKKKLRAIELSRQFSQDVLRRAGKVMEKMNEKAVEEANRLVDESRKRVLGK